MELKKDSRTRRLLGLWLADYGMVLVLLLLCAFFSVVTLAEQHPTGDDAARQLARAVANAPGEPRRVLIVVRRGADDAAFAERLAAELQARELEVLDIVAGEPSDARRRLAELVEAATPIDAIACTQVTSAWGVFDQLPARSPAFAKTVVLKPESYRWPNFLKASNLLNIANQNAVIAIIAIGMTMVIMTGGIDLSVGSLVALSAVVASRGIRDFGGGSSAGMGGMILAALAAMAVCGACGLFSGVMVMRFRIPPFIGTLGMMLVASGLAYILAAGQSIAQVPDAFIWLGRGADLLRIPNAVVLMLVLYAAAHLVMSRTAFGRYVYAVGGNAEAAWLSGVPVRRVLLWVYSLSGALSGLGGVIIASQLKSGAPTYGQSYELYVIAAVVVGGTSLSGGEGKILGTLVGASIIAVIQNGMNLTGVESYTQKVVLGAVILAAVLLDGLKRRGDSVG